jgi:imidazole glycerol-phosphate synthase subunit HisH
LIGIVDYDVGNVASIANMLAKVGSKSMITRDHGALREAKKIILPGVGAFDTAIVNLRDLGLYELMNELVVERRKPTLGVCLGAQLMGKGSEEGQLPGFGWLDFELVRFRPNEGERLKVPHMGWNDVKPTRPDIALFADVPRPMRFYFVHSYFMAPADPSIALATTPYAGGFTSVVGKGNVLAVQFHPEKSHKYGIALYRYFLENFEEC